MNQGRKILLNFYMKIALKNNQYFSDAFYDFIQSFKNFCAILVKKIILSIFLKCTSFNAEI